MKPPVLAVSPGLRVLCLIAVMAMASQLLLLAEPQFAVRIVQVFWDKVVHFAFFGVMAFLLWVAGGGRWKLAVWIAVVLVGAADEMHQAVTPDRSAELDDWLADALGAATALFLAQQRPLIALFARPRAILKPGG